MHSPDTPLKVAILVYDGVATFEFGCATELFALDRPEISPWYEGQAIALTEGPLRATGGITIEASRRTSLDDFDCVVVPSWPTQDTAAPQVIIDAIVALARRGGRVLSFCSGAFLLAEAGLLDGREATTHWRYAERFKDRFPNTRYVDNVLYVYDGQIGCSAGSAAAIDLGIDVIRQDFGRTIANTVARRLVLSPHRSGGQAQFIETPIHQRPDVFASTLDWAVQHLAQHITVETLADQANMSRRSFDRHFRKTLNMSPKHWLSQQRIQRAQQLLESSQASIEEIAEKSGFNNALSLRNNFHKHLGISPRQFRQQFGAAHDTLGSSVYIQQHTEPLEG